MGVLLQEPWYSLLLWSTVTVLLVTVSVYAVGRFRAGSEDDVSSADTLLTKFREMHSKGELTDEEFRNIKTTLAVQQGEEVTDTGERG